MKKLYSFIVAVITTTILLGQAPASFKYQAVLRDARGNIKANTLTSIKIDILQGSATGTAVYTETHSTTTDGYGLINLNLGNGTPTNGNMSSINWGTGVYFVKVTVDGVDMGTSQLLSVPYSLYAKTAGNGFSGIYSELTGKPDLFNGTWTSLTGKPTTISGYGITDAFNGTWTSLTGKPIFATVATSGSYADLINKPTLALVATTGSYTNLTNQPTLTNGTVTSVTGTSPIIVATGTTTPVISMVQASGTTDGYLSSTDWTTFNNKNSFDGAWSSLTGKPTTIAGYGITDAMSTTHAANGITGSDITNWNTAYSWGNHSGLYRPITYVPTWSEIASKPTTVSGFGIIDAVTTTGDQMITGNKTFSGTTTVITPVNATDAVNKAYVDSLMQYLKLLKDYIDVLNPIPTNGLIAYYPFSGNANDLSGNNLNGIVSGAILTADRFGKANSAYSFHRSKITVADNNLLDFTNNFSLCAWFKSDNKPDSLGQGIIGKARNDGGGGYSLELGHPGNLFGVQPNFPAVGFGINTGISPYGAGTTYHEDNIINGWHFMVGTYDGAKIRLYVDGIIRDSSSTNVVFPNFNRPFYIGRTLGSVDGPTPPGDTVRYFYGKIDDVRLYNRPLNKLEVQVLYNEGNIVLPVTDIDGNSYNIVKIGTQTWMAENLKTTKYSDGTIIPLVTSNSAWIALTTPAYCWFNNDATTYKDKNGGLYNLYTVMTGKLCPIGWHVPSNAEWITLGTFLGGDAVAGGKMKEAGTAHWFSLNVGATNESGFTGLPAGFRYDLDGTFQYINVDKNFCDWWSSTLVDAGNAYHRDLYNNSALLDVRTDGRWKVGFSVRCLKD